MKKIGIIIGLLIGILILTRCCKKFFEFNEYNNGCGVYNNKYPVYMGSNDWTVLTVDVRRRTIIRPQNIFHIKNIIGNENICYYGITTEHDNRLPNGTIRYRFLLKIHPYYDEEKIKKIKENLEKNKIYMYRIAGRGFN